MCRPDSGLGELAQRTTRGLRSLRRRRLKLHVHPAIRLQGQHAVEHHRNLPVNPNLCGRDAVKLVSAHIHYESQPCAVGLVRRAFRDHERDELALALAHYLAEVRVSERFVRTE